MFPIGTAQTNLATGEIAITWLDDGRRDCIRVALRGDTPWQEQIDHALGAYLWATRCEPWAEVCGDTENVWAAEVYSLPRQEIIW